MSLAWRLALRDLRGGLKGLRLLIVCLFLGVAALAGVGSLSSAIVAALGQQGRTILGGDIAWELAQREAAPDERAALAREGVVSEVVAMRAMASRIDAGASVLAELKGVDARWPLYGRLTLAPGALRARPEGDETAIAPGLADRLGVKVGERIRIGEATFRVIGLIADEPDRIGAGFTLGPTVLVDRTGLAATGLMQPGSLYHSRYRVRLPATVAPKAVAARIETRFPDAGWEVRDRDNGAPGTRRFIERLGQFLALVGLTALVVAGIGVGNGVASWLDERRGAFATMKALGAASGTIFAMALIQLMIATGIGVSAGLAAGALVPSIVAAVAGDALPIAPSIGLYPAPLALSAAYGLLIALLFVVIPLERARRVPAAALFRGDLAAQHRPGWRSISVVAALAATIGALAIGTAREPRFAAAFVGAAVLLLALLYAIGWAIRAGAARLPRPRRPLLRLAIANLHRPGAQTSRLVVALGLGLTLFATLAVIETNLSGQIARDIPRKAPSFFVLDIPADAIDRFTGEVRRLAPGATLLTVPSLRGPVVAVKGVRVADMKDIPEAAWVLRGDRGLTYAATPPEGTRIVSGRWWPADYAGPPLVSLDVNAAKALDLAVGDAITVSVLGVEIEARIASLRDIHWDGMGINFAMIFSPSALAEAPHSFIGTIALPEREEAALNRDLIRSFPSISLIRVKEVVATVGEVLGQLSIAVRAAAAVAIAAGIAVLIGAIAAARRARVYDAVLLKLLGATRAQVLAAQAIEHALLAAAIGLVALAFGAGAGWYVVTQVFGLAWATDWVVVLATLAGGAALTLAIGLAGALPALAARPARALREL